MENALEYSFEMPKLFSHTETVTMGGHSFVYVAHAWGLYFYGANNIRGGASLCKQRRTTNAVQVVRIRFRRALWPFRLVRTIVERVKLETVWNFQTSGYEYFISDGHSIIKNKGYGYRHEIKGLANNGNVLLTDDLLDLMFRSIDAQIMELYQTVTRLSSRQGTTSSSFKVRRA